MLPVSATAAASRENPIRMQAIGFQPFAFQLTAYVIAGALAGRKDLVEEVRKGERSK